MTPEEIALKMSEIELQKKWAEFYSDILKIGLPSIVAILASAFSFYSARRNKEVDEKIADAENRLQQEISAKTAMRESKASLLERKRNHVETALQDVDLFVGSMSTFCTQAITISEFQEDGKTIPQSKHDKLAEFDKQSYQSFHEANRAKRLLSLVGCNEGMHKLSEMISLASTFRDGVVPFIRSGTLPDSAELANQFQQMRSASTSLMAILQEFYDSLLIEEEC